MNTLENEDISNATFLKISDFLFKTTGIKLKEYKKYLVLHRLSKFVGFGRPFKNFEEYYQKLTEDKSGEILTSFINALTTNFSFFFRESVHFDFLRHYLLEKSNEQNEFRIWSAACSTGEEPYSIAVSALQTLPHFSKDGLKILATDISTKVLNTAHQGIYNYSKVKGHIQDNELKKYFIFHSKQNDFHVKEDVKNMIAFRYLNLLESYPFTKYFDIVFLRNVLIYFDNQEKEIIINKIYPYIKPGGYIILGLSESMVGINHRFTNIKSSIYQKKL
ncbi:MAG: hypothetical protein A2Y41_01455 [Spirochaetes bacterium GWB1_36_13]|nr:MAG: hypothetical protein A2Y41_01455 [Spirochaetes bacterium GWB1_36_13]